MRIPAAVLGVALLLALPRSADAGDDQKRRVTGQGYDGVVMPIDGAGWSVSDAQVAEFESLLPSYLRYVQREYGRLSSCPLDQYKRQYWVTRLGDEQLLWVHFFHRSTDLVTSGRWLEVPVQVSDGGDAYFKLRYSPRGQALSGFSINTGDQRTCPGGT